MTSSKKGEISISCLADNFKQPIAFLVERLLKTPLPETPDDYPRASEVDVSVSLVLLLVIQFESWVAHGRFFDYRPVASNKKREWKSALIWMKSLNDKKLEGIIVDLKDVYFLRDAIAHNHIWTYRKRVVQGKARYSQFNLDTSWQSSPTRVGEIVAGCLPLSEVPRTKRLNLVVAPSFVGRKEVATVFQTVKGALATLHKLKYVKVQQRVRYVRFLGELSFSFWNLQDEIERSFLYREYKNFE